MLVAQYESWSIPFAVILSVPVAAFGAVAAQLIMGLANDIYGQIGLIMLIGLASKHAILIVEFAMRKRKTGRLWRRRPRPRRGHAFALS